ncbi:MBipA, mitochondrial GTPase [Tribonema minus]|uniref:MBipA, mitochondrial GTPase n=1 Tax=Tribonema minus TaxID=303371 RepID=A0A836C927_9STRA|nr:MBipA, mitochondrial GTPase [Tribonema minus]
MLAACRLARRAHCCASRSRVLLRNQQARLLSAEPASDASDVRSTLACAPEFIRNVAIIAHVDHGKTTMVDKLLRACTPASTTHTERLMDSMDLEQERGITIMSKCTRLDYGSYTLNVVDTPGHADFGGEVERILSMVEGVLLVVDATEGPMSQTKFVLGKALAAGLRPVVVINKVDRDSARLSGDVENELFDLFVNLGADDAQLEYPTLYASGRAGWATTHLDNAVVWSKAPPPALRMEALLDAILEHVPPPCGAAALEEPFALAVNNIGADNFLGPLTTGKVESGVLRVGAMARWLARDGQSQGAPAKVAQVFVTRGTTREPLIGAAGAGDIVTIAGIGGAVGDTITAAEGGVDAPLATPPLPPPTLSMTFGANDGPLGGTEGSTLTASAIRARLERETENNVTLRVAQCVTDVDKVDVFGRGEMQLGILIETLRREGFEFVVSPPRVLTAVGEQGEALEPYEEVTVDVDAEHSGLIIDRLTGNRRGSLIEIKDSSEGKTRLLFTIPSRGLLGFGPEARSATRGSAIVNSVFSHMGAHCGTLGGLSPGKLVSMERGKATAYALFSVQDRGTLFVEVGDEVYGGMVIGECARAGDLEVNPCRAKKVSNVRSVSADEKLTVAPPRRLSVEELIAYMGEDEMLEVTPKSVRLRKAALDPAARAKISKAKRPSS